MECISTQQGELGLLLNKFRHLDGRRKSSHLDFYLTRKCDRKCAMCYTDSGLGITNTDINFGLVRSLLTDFSGVDNATFTGGEISILQGIDELINFAADRVRKLYVQTNGIGFVRATSFRDIDPAESVHHDLKEKFTLFPKNVQLVLPVTEFHMLSELGGRDSHRVVVKAASRLAHEWKDDGLHPQIRFIVKNTPGNDGSGDRMIKEFNLEGLSKDGVDNYPGFITNTGRGVNVLGMAKEVIPNSKSLDEQFEGGFSISNSAVFIIYFSVSFQFTFFIIFNRH